MKSLGCGFAKKTIVFIVSSCSSCQAVGSYSDSGRRHEMLYAGTSCDNGIVDSFDWLAMPFVVGFVRGTPRFTPDVLDKNDDKDFSGIRCPACKWRPTRSDTWMCECGEIWNTFATRGECPGCQKRWTKTQCRQCGTWSDHDSWYEERPSTRR